LTIETVDRRRAILVLGMHRSGTSALTRILSLSGAALPDRLIEPSATMNETGFWEPREIVDLHDEVLAAAGSAWDDVLGFPAAWFETPAAASFRRRLDDIIGREFGDASLLVVKDPRLCRLLPLWRPMLAARGLAPLAVIPIRNPLEIAASLDKRDGFGEGKSLMLWLGHFLAAEHDTRDLPRCFVSYDRVLSDGPEVVRQIGSALQLDWPRPPDDAGCDIDGFLSNRLRHHAIDDTILFRRSDIPTQIRDAYRWAVQAVEGPVPPSDTLDRIRHEITRSETIFAPAIAAIADHARRQSEQLKVWVDVAVERYDLIERFGQEIAVLQRPVGIKKNIRNLIYSVCQKMNLN
jgi:hypothetical protein